MSIKVEKTEKNNELKLTFTIEAAKFDEGMKKVYAKTAKYFNVPGFRKGKAPMNIIERQYGSEIFYEDTFNEIVPAIYDEELKANKIEAVSRPDIEITQIGKGQDLIFTAVVQTKPEVKLGKYKGIEIKKVEYTVKDEDINHELGHMQERNSRIVTVEDKPVEKGNIAVIDFEGFVDEKAFEGGKAEGYELEIGSNTFIPGFEEQLIGMGKNEEKEINVTFPKDYPSEDLKGKDVVFKVKVNEIKEKVRRELDKEFFEDLGMDGVDSLETLEKHVEEHLKEHKKMDNENKFVDEILAKIAENTEVEIPEEMVEHEITHMVENFENQLKMQGISLEVFYEMTKSDEKALRNQMKDEASKRVKYSFILEEIQNKENIKVTEEETNEKAETLAKQYGMEKDAFISAVGGLYNIEYELLMEKTINFLKENN